MKNLLSGIIPFRKDSSELLIITGLGNPGEKYKNTRHNIGFMVTGALAEKFDINGKFHPKFNSMLGKGNIHNTEVLIVQPQTYMNLSGEAVKKVSSWYKVPVENIFVVFDDVSIDFGRVRFRPSGSAGGHNGIKSIISNCGSENFPRLKVGIGPNPGEHLWKNYVLQEFSAQEKKSLPQITGFCVEAVESFIKEGIVSARNKYNGINILDNISQ